LVAGTFSLFCALALLARCLMLLNWVSSGSCVCVRSLFDSTSVESKLGIRVGTRMRGHERERAPSAGYGKTKESTASHAGSIAEASLT
jgi:hypothetical protein